MEDETKPNEYPCTLGGCVEPAPNGMTEEEWRLKNIEYAESLTYLSSAGLSQYKDLIDIMYEERTGKKLERETKTHEIEPVIEDIRVNEDRIVEKLIARMKEDVFTLYTTHSVFAPACTIGKPQIFPGTISTSYGTEDNLKATAGTKQDDLKATAGAPKPTPDYIKDMYKLPCDELKIPRMTQEQREKLLPEDRNYYDVFKVLQKDAEDREARIKLEFELLDKSDWHYFKQFVKREWSAAKELWKRWRGR